MNITELIISGFFTALIAVGGAIGGGYLGARLTLSLHERQETRRRKIDVLQRFRAGFTSKTWQGTVNEISVAFSDSDEVRKVHSHLCELIQSRPPGSHQNESLINKALENLIRAMHKDIGLEEPKEHWELRGFLSYSA